MNKVKSAKYLLILMMGLMAFLCKCIDPFQPEIEESADLLVINGYITDKPGWHYIEVSRTSPLSEPAFLPVRGCIVRVEDGNGQGATYSEYEQGVYRVELDETFLGINKIYKLIVHTPDGEEYQSEYDSLIACPPIESVYYAKEKEETTDPNITHSGLRFYVDVKGKAGDSRNFLWRPKETFEYHSFDKYEYFWDGDSLTYYNLPLDSLFICYRTRMIPELFTATTRDLTANELNGYPLHYISSSTRKLGIAYGIQLYQYSLSDEAFIYMDKMRSQISETGGMYEKQPSGSEGNIYNVNVPEEQVLGYFHSSQVKENWVLFKNEGDYYSVVFDFKCDTIDNWPENLSEPIAVPSFLLSIDTLEDSVDPPLITGSYCLDCRGWGGSIKPPDYWPENE